MVNYLLLNKNEIERIRDLWEKLNRLHYDDSHNFKEHYKNFTFDERIRKFEGIGDENIRIESVVDEKGTPRGYCISTVRDFVGEIDSLYIDEDFRSKGIGKYFVESALKWFGTKGCKRIHVSVAEGHENVFEFYEKFGFKTRMTTLEI